MSIETIKVPDIGGAEGVEVIEICVAVGDQVEVEDSLVVLESDKASMEVPSPMAGTVVSIAIADGDSLSEGNVILELETAGDAVAPEPEAPATPAAEPEAAAPVTAVENVASAEPAENASAATITEVINVPDMGDAEDVDVIEVCVNVGDELSEGDSLIVLETDKASMEIPAPKSGVIVAIALKEGDTVSTGSEIVTMEVAGSSAAPVAPVAEKVAPAEKAAAVAPSSSAAVQPAPVAAAAAPAVVETSASEPGNRAEGIYAGPAVRKLAREMGVDVTALKGTGPRGRISKDDLKTYVKTALTETTKLSGGSGIPAVPEIDFAKFGEITLEPLSKVHKLTAENMHRSWLNVPHVTQWDEADISELEDFRQSLKAEAEKRGVKITPLPFLLKAAAKALQEHPKFNASLHADGKHMVYKHYINIGMAVDTPAGLVVPVLKEVDKKSIWQLAEETAVLGDKAKNRKLTPAEMQGGCFTISSLGGIGGQGFTPIVNTPEVAIMGVSKMAIKPVWNGKDFEPRKMLPLSLSYDHRAINGADAGKFFTYLGQLLADIRRLVL